MRSDISWVADNVIYGMFLSDEGVIDRKETTIMSYCSMACMDILGTSRRHLLGLRRNGVDEDDCARIVGCVERIAQWAGKDTEAWVRVRDLRVELLDQEMVEQIKIGKI